MKSVQGPWAISETDAEKRIRKICADFKADCERLHTPGMSDDDYLIELLKLYPGDQIRSLYMMCEGIREVDERRASGQQA